MGEIAEMMTDGTLCQQCGMYIGSGNGFPTTCRPCRLAERDAYVQTLPKPPKQQCPVCKKNFRGLSDHMRDAHIGGV